MLKNFDHCMPSGSTTEHKGNISQHFSKDATVTVQFKNDGAPALGSWAMSKYSDAVHTILGKHRCSTETVMHLLSGTEKGAHQEHW